MRAASAFSFLDSAALPEDLMAIAAQRDLPAMALVDTNGVYGAPRFYGAAKKTGVHALVGVELELDVGGQKGTNLQPSESDPSSAFGTFSPHEGRRLPNSAPREIQ
jgi:error-prone DNA polymerase